MLLKSFLKRHSMFKHLAEHDLDALAHAIYIEEFSSEHVFVKEGKLGKEMYVLVEGEIKVMHYDQLGGVLETLQTLKPGEIFGLLSLVDHLPAAASCVAHGSVKVGILPRTSYNLLSTSAASIALGFQLAVAGQLASDLRHHNQTLRSYCTEFDAGLSGQHHSYRPLSR